MAAPILHRVSPTSGPTSGGALVRLTGEAFAAQIVVSFGATDSAPTATRQEGGVSLADVRTPAHPEGRVDVVVTNLDAAGVPVPGESVTAPHAYRFLRPRLVTESDLTRLVRTLLRTLKRELLANTSITVSVDYDDTTVDGLNVIAMAALPSLVLSGPRMKESRRYSTNIPFEDVVLGASGPEIRRRKAALTVDLSFILTAASESTIELLNLMAATATFFNRHRYVAMLRDPADAALGEVRWEMSADGAFRTNLRDSDGVRSFTCGFVVHGFDVDEGLTLDVGKAVTETALETSPLDEPAP